MSKASDPALSAKGWLNLQKSRAFVKQKYPYFYKTLIGLIPKHVPHIHTLFVTDTMVMGFDAEWFATLDVDVGGGCLIHEASHVLRDLGRIRAQINKGPKTKADKKMVGISFDIPLNDDLKKFGVKLPPWAIYSSTYGFPPGLAAEAYYELLKKLPPPPPGNIVCAGECGSCNGTEDPIVFDDEPGRSEKEVQYFKKMGAQEIRNFIRDSKMRPGDVPGSWKEFLEFDKEVPVVPWQTTLKHKAAFSMGRLTRGNADYSLRRPSKRSYIAGILKPGLIDYTPTALIIEDTSASMGPEQLKENRVELVSGIRQLGIEDIWYMSADVAVSVKPMRIRVQDLLKLPAVGRGGTSFIPSIEAAMRMRPKPQFIFYSTDGGGKAPEHKPKGVEFIWLLAPGSWTVSPCNWGIQILTTNDPGERKKYKILT